MNQTPSFDQSNPDGATNASSEFSTLSADQPSASTAVWQATGETDGMRAPEQSDLSGGQTDVDSPQAKVHWGKQALIDLYTVKTWIECHVSGKAPVNLITSDEALAILKGTIEAVRGNTTVPVAAELKDDPLWPTDGIYPDMAPPASQRDRWMFDQGRLAERRAVAVVAAEPAHGHRVAGWIQLIDGVQTQNFARDENELKLIDRLSGRVRAEGSEITYQAVYTLNLPAPLLKDS